MAIIAISRGSFAGGRAVASDLARQLGYPCLGREEALTLAARDYGIVEAELRKSLDASPRFWEEVPGKRLAYVKCLTAVLLNQVQNGNLVYHGNVGHLLLSGLDCVLRVRVTADLDYRINAAMNQMGLSREKAMAHILQVDHARSRWAKAIYGVDCEDATQYDVTFGLGRLGVAHAVTAILQLAQTQVFRFSDHSRKQFADLHLGSRVWAELAKNPQTRSAGIQVVADDGVVTITGSVHSPAALELIPSIARGVPGVSSVTCTAGMGTDWYW